MHVKSYLSYLIFF